MQYELSTDEFYAYGHLYEPWAYVDTEIVLTDYIEESKLSKAVSMALFRMPYYKVRISVATKPERYVLESNLNEFKVVREDDFLPFTDPRSGDHLITVSFSSRTIRIRISHVLCDAYGMNLFISFLLCAYCEKNEESYKPLELTADRSVLALEYDNPFDHIVPLDEI